MFHYYVEYPVLVTLSWAAAAGQVLAGQCSRACTSIVCWVRACFVGACAWMTVFDILSPLSDMAGFEQLTLPEVGDNPHQPRNFAFPKRKKKPVMRSFRENWFQSWPWLHYQEEMDVVFCHVCVRALKEKKMKAHCCDAAFVSNRIRLGTAGLVWFNVWLL